MSKTNTPRAAQAVSVSDAQIAALRDKHGITASGRGIRAFEQVKGFVTDVLALAQPKQPDAAETREQAIVRLQMYYGRLAKATIDFLFAVDERHDTKEAPFKYSVPYGAVNALRAAVEGLAPIPQPADAGDGAQWVGTDKNTSTAITNDGVMVRVAPNQTIEPGEKLYRLATSAQSEDSRYPYYELRFIMRVLSHAGGAPKEDWQTAYGMARAIFVKWHAESTAAQSEDSALLDWIEQVGDVRAARCRLGFRGPVAWDVEVKGDEEFRGDTLRDALRAARQSQNEGSSHEQ